MISPTCGELRAVPREGADARLVAAQRAHLLAARCVPDLHLRAVGAHGDVLAVRAPLHGGDVVVVVVRRGLAQLLDLAGLGAPQVNRAPESHGHLVVGALVRRPGTHLLATS